MPLLGQEPGVTMQRNRSEPLGLNLKYYFIAHHEYTEATGKEGRQGWAGCQQVCHGALSAERVMDYFLSSICCSQHCCPVSPRGGTVPWAVPWPAGATRSHQPCTGPASPSLSSLCSSLQSQQRRRGCGILF